jgi:anti-sigma factor RsiW
VTKPDNGVAPATSRAAQAATHHGSVGVAELTHAEVRNSLSDYLDNSLAPGERRRIDAHLDACRSCTAYMNTLRATVRVAETLPRPTAPTHARTRILDAARREAADGVSSSVPADIGDSSAAADS